MLKHDFYNYIFIFIVIVIILGVNGPLDYLIYPYSTPNPYDYIFSLKKDQL